MKVYFPAIALTSEGYDGYNKVIKKATLNEHTPIFLKLV